MYVTLTDALGRLWDKANGKDFRKVVQVADGYHSSPSGDKYLESVLRSINISGHDCAIDVGCGKGSAMRTMLRFPFSQVNGIELSEPIANIAKRNLSGYSIRTFVFAADARTFDSYDRYSVVYLSNPFPADVMLLVMQHLTDSLKRIPRRLTIIYNVPTCHEVVSRFFRKVGEYPNKWGTGIYVYESNA